VESEADVRITRLLNQLKEGVMTRIIQPQFIEAWKTQEEALKTEVLNG
jgi:hypothetical protein